MSYQKCLGSCLAVNLMILADTINEEVKPLIISGEGSDNPDKYILVQGILKTCSSQMYGLIEGYGKNKLPPHLEHVKQGINDILKNQEAKAND